MTQPLDVERLKKLLLVALSSDQPGEVMTALVKAKKVLGLANLDIHWLVGRVEAPPLISNINDWAPAKPPEPETYWTEQIDTCLDRIDRLRSREREFIESLLDQWGDKPRDWQPSPRQRQWLADIYQRVSR